MRWPVLLVCVGCASARTIAPGWHPSVWADAPADAKTQDAAIPFGDGQNGTELMFQVLGQARDAGATGLSNMELQVGRCIREVATAPHPVVAVPAPELERITYDVRESGYVCRRAVDQEIYHEKTEGFKRSEGFGEARTLEREECSRGPIQHVVTRARVDYDHHFSPPDWDAVAHWSQLALRAGELHCDADHEANELRLRLHFGPAVTPSDAPSPPPAQESAEGIAALAMQAEVAAKAGNATEATRLAHLALDAWGNGDAVIGLTEPAGKQLAGAVAQAKYYALEADAAAFLALQLPIDTNAAWAAAQSDKLDRLTTQYHAIGEAIRMPEAEPWLHAGAAKLAALHLHVAEMLDRVDQHRAAEHQREVARGLETASRGR
jgi:hypothetical protein